MINAKNNLHEEFNSVFYEQNDKLKTNMIYSKKIASKLQAPDLEQAHTKCGGVKHKCVCVLTLP